MAWRPSHYVVASLLAGGALAGAARAAWPWRRPLTAAPIVVTQAYREYADTLGKRETLSDVLSRVGITGRNYAGFLQAATGLPARRLRSGLVFHFRAARTDSVADRVMVRLGPERRLWFARGDSGWSQHEEQIPWTVTSLRVVGTMQSSL